MLNYLSKAGTLCLCILLFGCMSTAEKKIDFSYNITASSDINPDIQGRPSSVVVRIFQLTNKLNFENASYDELLGSEYNALGTEFINLDEYLIDPDTKTEIELKISENTTFIGVAVGYRSVDMVTWRTVMSVPEQSFWRDSGLEIKVERLSVRVITI